MNNRVDWSPDPTREGAIWREKGRPVVKYMSCVKTAEPVDMPFVMLRLLTRVCQRNHLFDGVQIATREMAIFRAKRAGPGHARICSAVDILKAT